jgi:hypothetical protein
MEFYGHIISGVVKDEAGIYKPNVVGYASSPSKTSWLTASRSNDKGEVFFTMRDFYDTKPLVLQTNRKTDSLYHLELSSPFSSDRASEPTTSLHLNSSNEKSILTRSVGMQVQDVYAENEDNKKANLKLDSISFYGKADEIYLLDDYTRFPVIEEILREYVPGVMVSKQKDGFHFSVVDRFRRRPFEGSPLILLDGIPVFDENEIMKFDPLKVKKLEIVTSRYFIGAADVPGIVSFTTYTGDLAGFKLNPNHVTLNYEALQLHQEFYTPQYQSATSNRLPDFRSLLYWNPAVEIDESGKQTFEFFTSDLTGKYQVIVEGISISGKVGGMVTNFIVRE